MIKFMPHPLSILQHGKSYLIAYEFDNAPKPRNGSRKRPGTGCHWGRHEAVACVYTASQEFSVPSGNRYPFSMARRVYELVNGKRGMLIWEDWDVPKKVAKRSPVEFVPVLARCRRQVGGNLQRDRDIRNTFPRWDCLPRVIGEVDEPVRMVCKMRRSNPPSQTTATKGRDRPAPTGHAVAKLPELTRSPHYKG